MRRGVPRLPSRSGRLVHGGARMGLEGFWAIGGLDFVNGYPNMTGGMGEYQTGFSIEFHCGRAGWY